MRTHRRVALALALLGATVAAAPDSPWERELQFARLLGARGYHDLARIAVDRLQKATKLGNLEQATLDQALGAYFADQALEALSSRGGLQLYTEDLALSRSYYEKYLSNPAIKNSREYEGDRFAVQLRLCWITRRLAEGYVRMFDDPDVPKADKAAHKAKAMGSYNAAVEQFDAVTKQKDAEVKKVKAAVPKDLKQRPAWEKEHNRVREELVTARRYYNDTRRELGKFLKESGSPEAQWRPPIEAAAKDFKQMLLDFTGAPGIIQLNVDLAKCLLELGPQQDKEALERLEDVWRDRSRFRDNKLVPCEAAYLKAAVLFRQKKHKESIDVLEEMLTARTQDAWPPEVINNETVRLILDDLAEGDSPKQYDRKATGGALLLLADAHAALAEAAEAARKPAKDVRREYGLAYFIAVGVSESGIRLEPKYGTLLERWRTKAKLPPSLTVLIQMADDALRKKQYGKAAQLYTDVLARSDQPPDQARKAWDRIARCYYMNNDNYEAAIVFSAIARWFPEPSHVAYETARLAVGAAKKQFESSKQPFDEKFHKRLEREAEALSPLGPGSRFIQQAIDARKKGQFDQALRVLATIRPESPAYAHALYQIALTRKAIFEALKPDDQKGIAGQRALNAMLESFQAVFDHYDATIKGLQGEENADRRDRLVDVAAAALAIRCDIFFRPYVNQPDKVLEITTDLEKKYPGIEKAPTYPVLYFSRMRAAYLRVRDGDLAEAEKFLPIVEECWKKVTGFTDFSYLDKASAMGADAYNRLGKKLADQAKTASGEAKVALEKRAAAAVDRGLEFYLELVKVAPNQKISTYRYIFYQLENRVREPKTGDYRTIIELTPKVLRLFGRSRGAAPELLYIKLHAAVANCRLEQFRDAVPFLEDIDKLLEPEFQERMAEYDKQKKLHEERPNRVPQPKRPTRRSLHLDTREWLARCYVETGATDKYKDAEAVYADHIRLYPRTHPKYWDLLYWLCETYRLQGRHEDALRQVERAGLTSAWRMGDGLVKDGKGTRADFAALIVVVRRDVGRLPDASRKNALLPICDRILSQLKK